MSETRDSLENQPGDNPPFTTAHLTSHLVIEADFVVERGVVTRGQRIVIRDLLLKAKDDIERLSETYDALVANSSAEHQRMSELCHALSTNVIRLDEQHERDAATIDYWKGQFERREDDYARLYAQAEDIKEQYRDCASELAASRRHLAAAEAEAKDLRLVMHTTGQLLYLEQQRGQLLYLEQQRWQEMAELLWEELQEWHAENCGQADDGTPIGAPCTCHRILAAKWDEITNADDWADDEPVDNDHA